jgi:PAS domain S-box-containing protein
MRDKAESLGNRAAPAPAAATLTILLGLAALTGWSLGIPALTNIVPGAVTMKANTAGCIVLAGVALLILSRRTTIALDRFSQALSLIVLFVALATLAEYFFGLEFGIDQLLFADRPDARDLFRGRMSPFSAAALVAIAAALIALPHRHLHGAAKGGAISAMLIGATSLLGYSWGAAEITTDRLLPPVALNTALSFVLLGGGILWAPPRASSAFDKRLDTLAAVEIKILAGFVLALSLLLIGGAYTYRTTVRFADSVEWVAHSQEVRAAVASVYGSLAGSEVALRDYLLTRDESSHDEYQRLTGDVRKHLNEVRTLTVDNPVQQRNVAELWRTVDGRIAAMTSALTAFADFGLPAARAVIAVTRKVDPTSSVRAQTERMDAEEMRLVAERERATANVRTSTLFSLLATLLIATALFLALFRGVHREMRARREAEDALRASDSYNRSVLNSSPDCLCVLDLDGRVVQMTPHGRQLMEIDDFATVENFEWLRMWQGADLESAGAALDLARSGLDARFQGFCPTLKGVEKWWDVIVMPILGGDGKTERLLTVSRDISDVKATETTLRETNRFLDSLFESLPVMVVIKDAATLRIVRCNPAYSALLGYSSSELIGKASHDLYSAEEAELIVAKDREVLETGKLVEIPEQAVLTRHGGLRTLNTMKVPLGDRDGEPQFLMAISVDITARKRAEQAIRELNTALELKASQLEISNKELESFSYSVSHDLRAPLRAIDGFALMIEEDFSEKIDAEGRRYLAVIRENGKRMGALIDDLLTFSRLGRLPVARHEIDIESLVHEVLDEILSGRHPALGVTDKTRPQIEVGALPPVKGDRALLRQVWVNLLSNAIKYSSKTASPRIEVSGYANGIENLYAVRDNGVGFNMAYVEKLFGVFQRLHRADEFSGTGVGLAIVHRVISRHGGRVWAEGRVNDGATFHFALPKEGL